ncbi:MAG: TonB-dependent receptor [Steroidobacteraceae bacterium]|jgi:protein TonB
MMSDQLAGRGGASTARLWLRRALIGIGMLGFIGAVVLGGMNLSRGPQGPKRQVARIMILPDTLPPPPPPEEKKPPPKEEQPKQQVEAPKQQTPPEPQQLKMEGQAGEGPSAFAAGEVKQDYIGGDIGDGSRYAGYVSRLEQMIQDELTRHKLRVTNVKVFLWLLPDGSVQRVTVAGGDGEAERSVRTALADLTRVNEAPVADMPMPVGLEISVR